MEKLFCGVTSFESAKELGRYSMVVCFEVVATTMATMATMVRSKKVVMKE
jgi:hypothetical protein